MEEALRDLFAGVESKQTEYDDADEISQQGERDDRRDKDQFLPKGSFYHVNIDDAEREHRDELAEAASRCAHEYLVAADVHHKSFSVDGIVQ